MRRWIEACALAAAAFVAARPALAQTAAPAAVAATTAPAPAPPAPPPAPPARSRVRAELLGGVNTPLGTGGGALVVRIGPWLSIGAGAGVMTEADVKNARYALFARVPVLRAGRFTVGPVATASRGDRDTVRHYQRPQYAPDTLRWTWDQGTRLDLGVGAETTLGSFTARLEAGLGYVLGAPTCTYGRTTPGGFYVGNSIGACDAASIPAYYHLSPEPGRIAPYVGLSLGYEGLVDTSDPDDDEDIEPEAPGSDDARSSFAYAGPTALTAPAKSVTTTLLVPFVAGLGVATVGLPGDVELTAGAGTAFAGQNNPLIWAALLKVRVLAREHFHLALAAGGLGFEGGDNFGRLLGAGPIASFCFDEACRSVVSASVLAGGAMSKGDDTQPSSYGGFLTSVNAVIGLVDHLKLVGEAHVLDSDVLWIVAARIPIDRVSLDLGLAMSAPVGSVSLRW